MRPFDRTVLFARGRRLEERLDQRDEELAVAIVNAFAAALKKSK